jgi:4-hydroxy-2-oxoheptanedioate aldolase
MQSLPDRLRAGGPLIATFSMIASPIIVELIAKAGFEAVVLDMEHGPIEFSDLNVLVPAARAAGIHAIVRVRHNEASLISSALDVGASGVLVPQIDSAAAAVAVVRAARFAPLGHRGVNPYTRAAGYNASTGWFSKVNAAVAVLVMVEGSAGIAALPEIISTAGIDAVFVGPFDLSQSLGVAGQTEHPSVLSAIESIAGAAAERNLASAVFAPSVAAGRRWLGLGVRMVAVSYDTAVILEAFRSARKALE